MPHVILDPAERGFPITLGKPRFRKVPYSAEETPPLISEDHSSEINGSVSRKSVSKGSLNFVRRSPGIRWSAVAKFCSRTHTTFASRRQEHSPKSTGDYLTLSNGAGTTDGLQIPVTFTLFPAALLRHQHHRSLPKRRFLASRIEHRHLAVILSRRQLIERQAKRSGRAFNCGSSPSVTGSGEVSNALICPR